MKVLALICLIFVLTSAASYENDPKYFTIASVDIITEDAYTPEPLVETVKVYRPDQTPPPARNVDWGKVIAIGEKVYEIIEKGKPVTESKLGSISCVPPHLKDDIWSLFGARRTSGRTSIVFKNLYSLTVAKFDLRIEGYYNLQTDEHAGYFIKDAAVRMSSFECAWGYTCKAAVKNSVINTGNSATPVCEAQMIFDYHVSTLLKDGSYSSTFRLDGRTGSIYEN
ncbi:hypothetical protein PCE1_000753 [Barthelona sp. PCE]